jgi:Mg-chelatase subunit ChlD
VGQQTTGTRRDAYSVVLFNHATKTALANDSTSSPDQLLGALLNEGPEGSTNFASALSAGEAVMVKNWSPERLVTRNPVPTVQVFFLTPQNLRTPIMIFLSDGECSMPIEEIQDVCRSAVRHG